MSENLPKKRERKKTVDIKDRTFEFKDFDPILGNYILVKLLTLVMPMGIGNAIGDKLGIEVGKSGVAIDKEGFMDLQADILKHCFEILPGNKTPVMREDGTYGTSDISSMLCIKLLIGCVVYNFSDFFEDDLFSSAIGLLPDMSQ